MDNLARDMIECKKAGFGCQYGRWKATQEPVKFAPKPRTPKGWKECKGCGKAFKPRNGKQKYCDSICRDQTWREKNKDKLLERYREYAEKRRERAREQQ